MKGQIMGAVSILTPIVIAAWPTFGLAVAAAASSLGYAVLEAAKSATVQPTKVEAHASNAVTLEIHKSEVVTDQLARDQKITVTREGVTVTFSRDARGKATLSVTGQGHSQEALRAMGEEMSKRVVQQYVYQKLMKEVVARQFLVVEEEVDENNAIHMKVRHWEN
jgi:tRNA(Phe) wybutosine-synthesizing methylase Tyw3